MNPANSQTRGDFDPPAVSVVMPVYCGERYLNRAIDSILGQEYYNLELIIIDDGSTDSSWEIIEAAAERDRRIVPIRNVHGGIAHTMNTGLAMAKGRYFAPMDQDDVSCKDRLNKTVSFMESNPSIAAVGGAVDLIDNNDRFIKTRKFTCSPDAIAVEMRKSCVVDHSSTLVRTRIMRQLGGYRGNLHYSADYDLWLRILDNGRIANLPDVILNSRRHPGQVTGATTTWKVHGITASIAYLSWLSRRHDGIDPVTGSGDIVAAGVELFERFALEKGLRDEASLRHFTRFLRYIPLNGQEAVTRRAVAKRYVWTLLINGHLIHCLRSVFYLFHNIWTQNHVSLSLQSNPVQDRPQQEQG